jgi:hypothetical protein
MKFVGVLAAAMAISGNANAFMTVEFTPEEYVDYEGYPSLPVQDGDVTGGINFGDINENCIVSGKIVITNTTTDHTFKNVAFTIPGMSGEFCLDQKPSLLEGGPCSNVYVSPKDLGPADPLHPDQNTITVGLHNWTKHPGRRMKRLVIDFLDTYKDESEQDVFDDRSLSIPVSGSTEANALGCPVLTMP